MPSLVRVIHDVASAASRRVSSVADNAGLLLANAADSSRGASTAARSDLIEHGVPPKFRGVKRIRAELRGNRRVHWTNEFETFIIPARGMDNGQQFAGVDRQVVQEIPVGIPSPGKRLRTDDVTTESGQLFRANDAGVDRPAAFQNAAKANKKATAPPLLLETRSQFKNQLRSIIESGNPKNFDAFFKENSEAIFEGKARIDLFTSDELKGVIKTAAAKSGNGEMSIWILKNIKNKAVLESVVDGLIEGNHYQTVGKIFDNVRVDDLSEPFIVFRKASSTAAAESKTEFIREITEGLSKYNRKSRDLVWIEDLASTIKHQAPPTVKEKMFDEFVKAVKWKGIINNDQFYKVLGKIQDEPNLARRWAQELISSKRTFKINPAIDDAYNRAKTKKNKALQEILEPFSNSFKIGFF
jgi:hypothetical protein